MDYDVLFMCAESQDNFKKYRKYVKDHCIQPETKLLLDVMADYYVTIKKPIDWDAFDGFLFSKHAARLGKMAPTMKMVIAKMKTYVPSVAYSEVIKSLIELDYVAQIMQECQDTKNGKSDLEHVHEITAKALKDLGRFVDVDSMFVSPDITSVVDRILTSGYEWRMKFLNQALGPLRDGDFVLIAARVECGKTTFLASEMSHILPQMPIDRPLVWVNNEERSEQVFFRFVQSMTNLTTEEVKASPTAAMTEFEKLTGGRKILITEGKTNHEKSLTSLFQDVNPGLIVFDQLDNVNGFSKEDREDLRLGRLYKWARELAQEYGPVIAASQLTADVDNKVWPSFIGMESLRGSKVDKPGAVDAILTIGKATDPRPGEEFQRSLSIPKNKLAGCGSLHDESMRHGQALVTIDTLRGRYIG